MPYLPYNLSSISPLASTTAALHLLPVLQPLQPSAGERPAAGEPAPVGASSAIPTADVTDVASLLQAAQDETYVVAASHFLATSTKALAVRYGVFARRLDMAADGGHEWYRHQSGMHFLVRYLRAQSFAL